MFCAGVCLTLLQSVAPGPGSQTGPADPPREVPRNRNLVLVLLDDAPLLRVFADWHRLGGLDEQGAEGDTTGLLPQTPVIDSLAEQGRRFPHTYVSPLCSPTRASILTGVYAFRHGVGHVMRGEYAGDLAEYGDPGFEFQSLSTRVSAVCRTGLVGKVHLSIPTTETVTTGIWTGRFGSGWGILDRLGFDTSATVLRNLYQDDGVVTGGFYYFYGHHYSGQAPAPMARYATVQQVDEAIEFLTELRGRRGFLLLALSAAHAPWGPRNFPPRELVTSGAYLDASADPTAWPSHMASMEALDSELGRLLASIPVRVRQTTTFVILSDNGVDETALREARDVYGLDISLPWSRLVDQERLKASPYRFGVWGPMIWSGPTATAPAVDRPGSVSLALIDAVDLHPTIAEYFECDGGGTDGESFLELAWHGGVPGEELGHARQTGLSEAFRPMGYATQATDLLVRSFRSRVAGVFPRSGLFELVRRAGSPDELYQLEDELGAPVDPHEGAPLDIEGEDAGLYEHITLQLDELLGSSLD